MILDLCLILILQELCLFNSLAPEVGSQSISVHGSKTLFPSHVVTASALDLHAMFIIRKTSFSINVRVFILV